MPTVKAALCLGVSATLIVFCGCGLNPDLSERELCDMTPDGSVWLTVVRLVWAEQKFHAERREPQAIARDAQIDLSMANC